MKFNKKYIGQLIGEYTGEMITEKESTKREKALGELGKRFITLINILDKIINH